MPPQASHNEETLPQEIVRFVPWIPAVPYEVLKIELPSIWEGLSIPNQSRMVTGRSMMLGLFALTRRLEKRVPGTRSLAIEWSPDQAHGLRLMISPPVAPMNEVEELR